MSKQTMKDEATRKAITRNYFPKKINKTPYGFLFYCVWWKDPALCERNHAVRFQNLIKAILQRVFLSINQDIEKKHTKFKIIK